MPYIIELMAIGEDTYPPLSQAAEELNGIQDEFKYVLPPQNARADGIAFKRDAYLTTDVWNFLREHREKFHGKRDHIIAFITRSLRSEIARNIFGSQSKKDGLTVVTTSNYSLYVKEEIRFYCYYILRYTLSFVNPHMKCHNDTDRKDCYFHYKKFKPEIRASMDKGHLCDQCRDQLERPPPEHISAHCPSSEEIEAINRMLSFVAKTLPSALILKGGGVKGLAFAGALTELERHYFFDRHVGTSAGAIAAVLLAAGYTPSELTDILLKKSFRDFMDAPAWKIPFNLLFLRGMHSGQACANWISKLLGHKLPRMSEVAMKDLSGGALVYAARSGSGTISFDSRGDRKETSAAYAARCSMSIPFFFAPAMVDGRRVFDGGLRHNFPLTRYLSQEPRANFIGLYLGKRNDQISRYSISLELLDIVIEGEERATVDRHADKVIVIDTSPIRTVDFDLSEIEKQLLLSVGKASALQFLFERNLDNGPSLDEVTTAISHAESLRIRVVALRKRSRFWKRLLVGVVVIALALSAFSVMH